MIIELREDIGIKNIKNFHSQLKDAMREESGITLDFSKVRRIDFAVVQVLMAARKKLKSMKKELIFKSIPPKVKKELYICGLLD